jgi:uncharacterized protein (TIGR00297 family)
VIERGLAGLVLAGALAAGARRHRSLSRSGAFAALIVGTAAVLAGWGWAALLVTFFLTATTLSRYRHTAREARIASIVEKGDERDAAQVFANGGVFAAAAVIASITGDPNWAAAGMGALAAATADTFGTEVGTLAGRPPRSIVSFKALEPGASGGVTTPGTLASIAGAALIAVAALVVGLAANPLPILLGGIGGSLADSLAGATVQERRWCDGCSRFTERRVHTCGTATRVSGGVSGIRNDLVNLACTAVGAGTAVLWTR